MSAPDKVRVLIIATERVTYRKVVEMTPEKFREIHNNLNSLSGRELREYEERVVDLNTDRQTDFFDADDVELQDFMEAPDGQ